MTNWREAGLPRPPTHDVALVCELGRFVVVGIMRQNEPDWRRRAHTVRRLARKAIGEPGPPPMKKKKSPPPPKTTPVEVLEVPSAPRPSRVAGERVCHACLLDDAEQRERYAKELATQSNYVGASKETAAADRLRALIASAPNRDCSFHRAKPRVRKEIPEPTVRPPGLAEVRI